MSTEAGERPPAVELRELVKSYGDTPALRGVSLRVERGEVFGYVGPNGAGKTTTIKLLVGLLQPTSGDALVSGASVREQPLLVKRRVGYVPESGAVFERLSAREYLTLTGRLYDLPEPQIEERTGRWLQAFDLSSREDEPLGALSKGMRQKVCWAAAVLHDPDVLVLDEPLNGLDVEAVAHVKELMRGLASEGKTVFYSSHLMDVVEKVCHRVAVIQAGRLVTVGSVDQVRGSGSLEEALLNLAGGGEGARA